MKQLFGTSALFLFSNHSIDNQNRGEYTAFWPSYYNCPQYKATYFLNISMTKKTKSPFSDDFLQKIKELLLTEKARLSKETGIIDDTAFPEYGEGEDDNAREIADFTANKPVEITLENELRDVLKSLKRLQEGTYGICKYCDQPIDDKRLLARPTSSSCVSCKKTVAQEA